MTQSERLLPLAKSCQALVVLIGLLFWDVTVSSQCNPPEQLPTNYCETAPLNCLLNACYQTIQDNFTDCCSGWCMGGFTIHNPQFFEMIAASTTIEIHIDVISCDDGTSLQGAIIGACPWAAGLNYPDILTCDGQANAGYTMVLMIDSATIGNSYWLMIDGYSGALCNYLISYVSGILIPPLEGVLDPDETMAIPDVVCPGYGEITVVASPPIGLAHGYMWITEWNNDTIFSTLPEITMNIPENMPPGVWDICIIPYSGCDTLEELCVPLEVVVVDDGLVEVFHCLNENFDPYTYEGEDYYSPGNYELLYPGMGLAECDSVAVLQLTMVGVDAFIELTCAGSDFVLVPLVQEVVPANANIDWSWYESGSGIVISNDSTLHTTEDGCYDLFATIEVPEGECTMQIGGSSFCFEGNQYLPDAPEVNSDTIICAQPGVVFEVSNIPGGEQYTYIWSAPSDVPVFQNDSSVVVMDFTNSTGGEVCVYAIGSCGTSPSSCFNVIAVNALEVPVINCTSTINSILFDWNDISGTTEYLISLDHNAPFSVAGSEYLVQPLSPGTEVHILLTIPNTGPCPSVMDSITCIAQNCDPATIVLSGIDSVCLNSAEIIQLDAEVNGSNGIGTWIGSGIIDSVMGLFDPSISGPGIQQIIFNTIVNGCPFSSPFLITVFDSLHSNFHLPTETCVDFVEILGYDGNASASAIFNFDFGDATLISGSGTGPYRLSWSVPGMKTITLQVMENGCVSEVYTRQIRVDQTLEPPIINCSGTDSTVLFSFILDPFAFTHDIDPITMQSYQSVNNTIEFFGLTPGEEVIIEFITYSDGPCPNRLDTFSCVARSCPMPVIVVDPVNDICLYPGTGIVNLQVNVTGGTGTGAGEWSGPGVVDIITGIFNPNVAGAGAHQVNYHFKDDGCDFNNPITINVYDPPQAFISNTDLMITCTEPSLFLDGSGSSGTPLLYSWSTATGTITGPKDTPTAEVTAPGVYQLLVTNATSGCKDSISVTVTIDASIPIANAGPDKTITCDSTLFVLGGASTTGTNIIYQWTTSGGGHIVGLVNGLTVVADSPGDYTIMVRDTSTGCQASDQVVVGIDTATATINLIPGDTIDCNTPVSTLTSTLDEPFSDYTYNWSTIDGNFSGQTGGPNVNVQQGGTYTLTIHNKRNGCETSADVVVPESDDIIDAVDVTQRNVRCFGEDNGVLIINGITGGIAPYDFEWNVSTTSGDSLTQLSPGNYILTVSDQNGCSFVETYTITEPALITLDLGSDLIVADMDSVIINITTNLAPGAIGSIEWSGFAGLQCSGCPSLEFIASISSTISAIITDTAGCIATDNMNLTVIVPRIVFIPNIFSPNEDGVNDFFTISGRSNLINIAELHIYDRWGNEVFGKTNLTPGVKEEGWDGKFKNENMQPGVYIFVAKLEYEDLTETIRGNLTLIR